MKQIGNKQFDSAPVPVIVNQTPEHNRAALRHPEKQKYIPELLGHLLVQNGEFSDISGEFEIAKLGTNNMFKQLTQVTRDDFTHRRPSDLANINDIPDLP